MSENLGSAENFKTPEKNQGVRRNLYELEFRMMNRDDVIPVSDGVKRRITPYSAEWLYTMYEPLGSRKNPIVIE